MLQTLMCSANKWGSLWERNITTSLEIILAPLFYVALHVPLSIKYCKICFTHKCF